MRQAGDAGQKKPCPAQPGSSHRQHLSGLLVGRLQNKHTSTIRFGLNSGFSHFAPAQMAFAKRAQAPLNTSRCVDISKHSLRRSDSGSSPASFSLRMPANVPVAVKISGHGRRKYTQIALIANYGESIKVIRNFYIFAVGKIFDLIYLIPFSWCRNQQVFGAKKPSVLQKTEGFLHIVH